MKSYIRPWRALVTGVALLAAVAAVPLAPIARADSTATTVTCQLLAHFITNPYPASGMIGASGAVSWTVYGDSMSCSGLGPAAGSWTTSFGAEGADARGCAFDQGVGNMNLSGPEGSTYIPFDYVRAGFGIEGDGTFVMSGRRHRFTFSVALDAPNGDCVTTPVNSSSVKGVFVIEWLGAVDGGGGGNAAPSTPALVSPVDGHTFGPSEAQAFAVSSTDPDGDPYVATITVRDAITSAVVRTITAAAASGSEATGATVPLPPGSYTWSAHAADAGGAASGESGSRSFSVAGTAPNGFPSDDCTTGTVVDGYVNGSYVKLRVQQPDAQTTWICERFESGGVAQGTKTIITTPGVSSPGLPTTDGAATACASPGNGVPGPHPTLKGAVGDPSDPPYVPFLLDTYLGAGQAWLCLQAGSAFTGRVIVPLPVTPDVPSIVQYADSAQSHLPPPTANPGSNSGACDAAATGTKRSLANADVGNEHVWLSTWQESTARTHVCVRGQGISTAGGRLTVDASAMPGAGTLVTTSTTDMTPCTTVVLHLESPIPIDISRSPTGAVPASVCVVQGTTKQRVTVDPNGTPSVPTVAWSPDA